MKKISDITKKLFISCLSLCLISIFSDLDAQVKLTEAEWVLPTYPVDTGEKSPVFFLNESYQGASKYVYPLPLNDVISEKRTEKAWKTVTLENEFIKLCITPEIGGKLYYATDKSNNYNFIYKNNVVKPSNIGMTGAWVSGGIEWCVFHHHRPSTFMNVDYTTAENSDGSKTIWVGETEPRHGMRWTIGITMYPDRSYFQAEIKLINQTPVTNTILYWANVAAHTNENYQVIFPPSVQFATFHSKTSFARWPISTEMYAGSDFTRGVDISWWKNVTNSASFFAYDLKEDFMGGYDHGKQTGTVHIGDHNIVKGAKLWEWGSGPRGQATEGRLTENDGPYVEIMTGAYSDNQPDYTWIRPYEVKTIRQYWYPVKDIQGFKNANLNGAVNLELKEKNSVFLGYCTTKKIKQARVILKNGEKEVLKRDIEISPTQAYTTTLRIDGPFKLTDLYTELTDVSTGEVLVSYKPVDHQRIEKLPDPVINPPEPKEIATVEELFLAGSRIEQFYNPRLDAMDYYKEALSRDPGDVRTNTAAGNYYLKRGDYSAARGYFAKALKRLTKDYTRPGDCEALFLQGLTLKTLELFDEAIDTLYRATWDYKWHSAAYLELARISAMQGNFAKALDQVNESLSTNTKNNRAIAFKASMQRRLGDIKGALATIGEMPVNDPLDFRIMNDYYLIKKGSGDSREAENILTGLLKKMRDFNQNYLELAAGYLNDGLYPEAEDVLLRYNSKDPFVDYYLGYIADKAGKRELAQQHFTAASSQAIDYVFPFRLEEIKILKTALKYNVNDSRAYYYLGNILYDKQPAKAIEYWEQAVNADPGFAMAHRNLGWGYRYYSEDFSKAIASYEKAMSVEKNEAIFYSELDALYEMTNAPIEKRIALFEEAGDIVKRRDDSFVRQVTVLTLSGKAETAASLLNGINFSYREGNSRVREVIIDSRLMAGRNCFNNGEYKKALDYFLQAQIPDEEAGSARSGNRDVQVNYHIGLAYEALGNKTKSKEYYRLATETPVRRAGNMSYYQGLSFAKLGNVSKAKEVFEAMVSEGEKQLQGTGSITDAFAIFAEQEAENIRKSNSYTLRGLGFKGLGQADRANEDLSRAAELSHGNLWAKAELKM